MTRGYDATNATFVQSYDANNLDAATLIMPMCFFVAPNDPRMLGTLEAIMRPPERGGLLVNGLCYRYNIDETQDGLSGDEGTFSMCTFWYFLPVLYGFLQSGLLRR